MGLVDYAVIVVYFAVVIAVGFWYQRRAARSLESYFLGGHRLHWLAMAMSGSVATFDITGTMWIVTILYLFGMKSMWNHWMWGFLMAAFFMSYMGKWVRRSGVMTGAEWMVTRFGPGRDGRIARLAYTLMAVITLTAFVGYAFQGIGKFASEYVSFGLAPEQAARLSAILIFSVTTLYVLLGGLYSVVITNVIQTVVLTAASLLIAVVAYNAITPEMLAERLPAGFTSLVPAWRVEVTPEMIAADYAHYRLFGALVIVWVVKGLLLNAGGPGQMYDFQLFLATRNPRDASKLGAAWSGFLVVRWAMCMGIALLALSGLVSAASPADAPPAHADQPLPRPSPADELGAAVRSPARAAEGKSRAKPFDAERVMPVVLREHLRPGVRGLVIAGLLAAFMSTFSATVNAAASYVVRDLWQPLAGASSDSRKTIRASYAATVLVVVVGTLMGMSVRSIGQIWNWIMMELGAAFVIPNVLRWYWWRLNGWGYAWGTLLGLAGAIAVPFLPGGVPMYVTFPSICALSLVGCLLGTFLTPPTDETILASFYRSVRPFGLWGSIPATSGLSPDQLRDPAESLGLTALNVGLAGVVVIGAYLGPMYLVGHWHARALAWFAVAVVAAAALYFTWYRNLAPADRGNA